MFEVSIKTHFSAAHHLVGYKGSCADQHGHNWDVEVVVRGGRLDGTGMLIDFRCLKEAVAEVIAGIDHKCLNELPMFRECNPSSEHIAKYLYRELSEKMMGWPCGLYRVNVQETPGSSASYWDE